MGIPSKEKTWQHNVNQVVSPYQASPDDIYRQTMFTIKSSLVGFASNPWTVVGSSDSVTAGLDGTDRWASAQNLVWANNPAAHSWIVLKQTGVLANFQLLIDLDSSGTGRPNVCTVAVSTTAGFTGGSVTARPTATDESLLVNKYYWNGNDSTSYPITVVHALHASDGSASIVLICIKGSAQTMMLISNIADAVSGLTENAIFGWKATSSASPSNNITSANFYSTSNPVLYSRHSGTTFQCVLTGEGYGGNNALITEQQTDVPNEISKEYPMLPVGVFGYTAGKRGKHGRIPDLYWGVSSLNTGTPYPADGTRQWTQFGCFVFPWNGSVARTQ